MRPFNIHNADDMAQEGAPRNNVREYIESSNVRKDKHQGYFVSREIFEMYIAENRLKDGPYEDGFIESANDPYSAIPRQLFGTLDTGEIVYCEIDSAVENENIRSTSDLETTLSA